MLLTAKEKPAAVGQPIEIAELDSAAATAWDAFVLQCPQANFFHRAGWKRVIEKSFGHDCHFLYAKRGGAIVGVLPLVHIRSRLFGRSLISTGFTVGGGPAVIDGAVLKALDERAIALADRLDVDCLEYRSRTPVHDDWVQKTGLYAGFRRAITGDAERDLLAIPRKQRAMVRKGISASLASRIDADVDTLHHVYAVSVRNLGTPVFAKTYFRSLLEEFGADVDVVTIAQDGTALASVMSFYFRDEVLPYYGGGLTEARPVAANDFMYWEVMRRAGERGFRSFDFGRSKIGTGAFAFKKNWGFEPEPWTYEFKLRRGDVPDVNPLNPKYRIFVAAWQRMPIGLAKAVGPYIVRNLG